MFYNKPLTSWETLQTARRLFAKSQEQIKVENIQLYEKGNVVEDINEIWMLETDLLIYGAAFVGEINGEAFKRRVDPTKVRVDIIKHGGRKKYIYMGTHKTQL